MSLVGLPLLPTLDIDIGLYVTVVGVKAVKAVKASGNEYVPLFGYYLLKKIKKIKKIKTLLELIIMKDGRC